MQTQYRSPDVISESSQATHKGSLIWIDLMVMTILVVSLVVMIFSCVKTRLRLRVGVRLNDSLPRCPCLSRASSSRRSRPLAKRPQLLELYEDASSVLPSRAAAAPRTTCSGYHLPADVCGLMEAGEEGIASGDQGAPSGGDEVRVSGPAAALGSPQPRLGNVDSNGYTEVKIPAPGEYFDVELPRARSGGGEEGARTGGKLTRMTSLSGSGSASSTGQYNVLNAAIVLNGKPDSSSPAPSRKCYDHVILPKPAATAGPCPQRSPPYSPLRSPPYSPLRSPPYSPNGSSPFSYAVTVNGNTSAGASSGSRPTVSAPALPAAVGAADQASSPIPVARRDVHAYDVTVLAPGASHVQVIGEVYNKLRTETSL